MISDLFGIINKIVPNKAKAAELEATVQKAHQDALNAAVKADAEVRLAELKSSGIRAIWRPMAAIMTFLCLFLYWFIYPLCLIIVGLFNLNIYLPELPILPLEFYGLATAFTSIYAYGRSLEKRSK